MTDNKAINMFLQAKLKAPSTWKFCDQTLECNFALPQVSGVENPMGNNLSRLEIRPQDRKHLNVTKFYYSVPSRG